MSGFIQNANISMSETDAWYTMTSNVILQNKAPFIKDSDGKWKHFLDYLGDPDNW